MSELDEARRELADDPPRGGRPKRNRPRHRKPYRDSVLTVPATPERHALEELKDQGGVEGVGGQRSEGCVWEV